MNRLFLVGAACSLLLTPALHAQNRTRPPARPKPQKPLEVPPAVVLLPVDTTPGDSIRTIIQRDLDYGDRIQPLILDSATLADIWQPGNRTINFAPLAQTRANFLLRIRPISTGLHVEVYDPTRGLLKQEGNFRLPRMPANRLSAIRDSLTETLSDKAQATQDALAANQAMRDSLARTA